MVVNSTGEEDISPVNNGYNLIWIYVTWIFYFFIVALPNLIVSLTIIRHVAMRERKEYLIMAGLSFADFSMITAYAVAGIQRLALIYDNQWSSTSSIWSCVLRNVLFWFSSPTSGIMLIVVSLDRFLSVRSALMYFNLTKKYAHHMLGIVYGFGVFVSLLIIGLAFTKTHEQSAQLAAPCYTLATSRAVNGYYTAFYMYVPSVTGMLSVVLYVGVGVTYWRMKQQQVGYHVDESQVALDRKRQRNLTKNLAISCACTTVFAIVPIAVAVIAGKLFELPRLALQILWLLPPLNPLCNIVIYYKRQQDIRKGVKALFANKTLPSNLNLWDTVKVATKRTGAGQRGTNHK